MSHICHVRIEPRLEDLLADPILSVLLQADGIEERDLLVAIEDARRSFDAVSEPLSR